MQAARRLTAVTSVALIGSLLLAGCRSNPTVAAYVGDTQITEERVDAVIDDMAEKKSKAETATPAPDQPAEPSPEQADEALARTEVVTLLVLHEGCRQLAVAKNLTPTTTVTSEQFAASRQLPADSEYAALGAELTTCMSAVPASNTPPTEDELRQLFDAAKAADLLNDPSIVFDDIKGQLAQDQQVQQAFAGKRLYSALGGATEITVNPRYRPLTVQAFPGNKLLPVVIGDPGSGALHAG
jgi:hypothetical protein